MNEFIFCKLHDSADRLALEAARCADNGQQADCYTDAYMSVLEFLISEYEKHDPKES